MLAGNHLIFLQFFWLCFSIALIKLFPILGPIATYFIKRIGTRCTVMIGGVIVLVGFASSSLAPNLATLFFTYGLVAGNCCLSLILLVD
jgi:hypothetical protein